MDFTNLCAQQINYNKKDSISFLGKDSLTALVFYNDNLFLASEYNKLDTNLIGVQKYDQTNRFTNSFSTSSNIGLPHKSLLFDDAFVNVFNIGEKYQKQYFFALDNIPNYILKVPYSEIKYVMGKKDENYLSFTLANQISKGFFFGADINVESAIGSFINQYSKNNHFRTIIKANSKDGKYEIKFNYLKNHLKWGENGGLDNDFYYEDTTKLDRRIINVKLSNASNLINSNKINVTQNYSFKNENHNFGGLFLDADYSSSYRIYSDANDVSNYYNNSFIDSTNSFDSIAVRDFKSFFGWKRVSDSTGFSFQSGIQFSYNQFYNGEKLFVFNYFSPLIKVRFNSEKVEINAFGALNILQSFNRVEYNNGKTEAAVNFIRRFGKDFKITLEQKYYSGETEFMNLHYFSNHFIWNNNFLKQVNLLSSGSIYLKGFLIEGKLQNMNNYIYFDDSIHAKQFNGAINIYRLGIYKEFRFKKIGANLMATYQKVDNNTILRLPELISKTSVFYNFGMFDGALQLSPGIDISYLSSYYADGYNPAAMVFFVQN